MIGWIKLAAIAAALALAGLGGWKLRDGQAARELAEAQSQARETEQRWADHVIETVGKANAEAERLRAALARADAAHRSLHDSSARRAAEAASAPGTSPAAAATILLYAELHRELDEFAGEAARAADAARGAGLACQRHDEVTR